MSAVPIPASLAKDPKIVALLGILERWDDLPIEHLLVWHLPTTLDATVPFLGEQLGLDAPEFELDAGPPREVIAQGVALQDARGLPSALREVLRRLDFGEVTLIADGRKLYDGSIAFDGTWTFGSLFYQFVVGVVVDVATPPMSAERARQLWDAVESWKGQRDWFFLVLHGPGGPGGPDQVVYRSRAEIT